MRTVSRAVAITSAAIAVGALCGAALGGALMVAGYLRDGQSVLWWGVALGSAVGAAVGAFLAPLTGLLLLRRVPLGRAIGGTAAGAALGATAGLITRSEYLVLCLLGGYFAAALALAGFSLATRRPPRAEHPSDATAG